MIGYEFVGVFGFALGVILGGWIGGRFLLWRLHHDDVENAHSLYKRRKEKYLSKKSGTP